MDSVIVYISIGNSDDKLSQVAWSNFCDDVHSEVECWSTVIHGRWFSAPDSAYQNACWCVELTNGEPQTLKKALAELATRYGQDSIAWAEVQATEFLGAPA